MLEWIGIAKSIVLPPVSLFLLALVGWIVMLRHRRCGQLILGASLVALYLLSTPYVGVSLLRSLQVPEALALGQPSNGVGAIIVLGAGVQRKAPEYRGPTVDTLTLVRLRYAARLNHESGVPILVTGGTIDPHTPAVATAMRESLAQDFMAPAKWLEQEARNTHENALFSARILRSEGITDVYLVTHAWHMRRAALAFEGTGLRVVPAPTGFLSKPTPEPGDFLATAGGLLMSYFALHEAIGYLWYWFYYAD